MLEDFQHITESASADKLKRIAELADEVGNIDADLEELANRVAALTKARATIVESTIPELMAEAGVMSYTTENGFAVKVKTNYYANIAKAREEAAFDWLRKNGFGDLIKIPEPRPQVHPQTLKAFVREQIEKGNAIPENLFGVFTQVVAEIKRAKQ